jgi:predicted GIY-YIG superfamily endonuclease
VGLREVSAKKGGAASAGRSSSFEATVYLLHFDKPYRHAKHYVGYTALESLEERLERHRDGRGARLLAVCVENGIGFRPVRTWKFKSAEAARQKERRLKTSGGASRYCPSCKEASGAKI